AYALSNQDGEKYANQNMSKTRIIGDDKLTPGKHTIVFAFTYDGGGMGKGGLGTLLVDGKKVGEGRIERTQRLRFSLDESFDVGQDTGTPVVDEYDAKMPFKFSGTLKKVEVELGSDGLTPGQRGELQRRTKDFALRVQRDGGLTAEPAGRALMDQRTYMGKEKAACAERNPGYAIR